VGNNAKGNRGLSKVYLKVEIYSHDLEGKLAPIKTSSHVTHWHNLDGDVPQPRWRLDSISQALLDDPASRQPVNHNCRVFIKNWNSFRSAVRRGRN
jgi:hypothetical protein